MQKTLTINGKKFTAKNIAAKFDENNMTYGGDYIIRLNGQKFFANYRQIQDQQFAPVCSKENANAIALTKEWEYRASIWIQPKQDLDSPSRTNQARPRKAKAGIPNSRYS